MTGHGRFRHLGRTLDDAAGEAFDKGARLLGLGFPVWPAIENAAARVTRAPSSCLAPGWHGTHDFSFSGLKTALLRLTEPMRVPESDREPGHWLWTSPSGPFRHIGRRRTGQMLPIADLAAFQEAIVEPLAVKTARAALEFGVAPSFSPVA